MATEQDVLKLNRVAIRKAYGVLFDSIAKILFEADLMEIGFETNTDEYEPEVGTIIPRLRQANSEQDVQDIVHEEFCKWFGITEAGTIESYRFVAEKIWTEWQSFNHRQIGSRLSPFNLGSEYDN